MEINNFTYTYWISQLTATNHPHIAIHLKFTTVKYIEFWMCLCCLCDSSINAQDAE